MKVTKDNVEDITEILSRNTIFVIDIETSGLDILGGDELCGLGIGTIQGSYYYFPFRHTVGTNLDIKFLDPLLRILEGKTLIGHNIKFDIKGLYQEGMDIDRCTFIDTIVMARLCSTDRIPNLKLEGYILVKYIGHSVLHSSEQYKLESPNPILLIACHLLYISEYVG